MSEMAERACAAILAVDDGSWNITPGIEEQLVRAVIAAMREPTEAMIAAVKRLSGYSLEADYILEEWRAMIDEALSD